MWQDPEPGHHVQQDRGVCVCGYMHFRARVCLRVCVRLQAAMRPMACRQGQTGALCIHLMGMVCVCTRVYVTAQRLFPNFTLFKRFRNMYDRRNFIR